MSDEVAYVEASAAIKLFAPEPETEFLRTFLLEWPSRVSSELLEVEVGRVGRAVGRAREAGAIVSALGLVPISTAVLEDAVTLGPAELPVVAAVHVATALSLGGRVGAFVAYDPLVVDAARREGLRVASSRA